jgi:ATP-dependent NAD(P)H-hydrate dehydratase
VQSSPHTHTNTPAGARRCSSQGDILAGVLASFVAWTRGFVAEGEKRGDDVRLEMNQMTLAAFGGCTVTRCVCVTGSAKAPRL